MSKVEIEIWVPCPHHSASTLFGLGVCMYLGSTLEDAESIYSMALESPFSTLCPLPFAYSH